MTVSGTDFCGVFWLIFPFFSAVAHKAAGSEDAVGSASLLDSLVDFLFLAGVSHVGTHILSSTKNAWSYATFFGHWLPLFYTYTLLEGFVNRFSRVKGLSVLYFFVSLR